MQSNKGRCFVTEYRQSDWDKHNLNNPIRCCIAFEITNDDNLHVQFCKVYKGSSKHSSDMFTRKAGREIAYTKLDETPIQYDKEAIYKVADLGIHASFLRELPITLNMFTKSKLARMVLELLINNGFMSKNTFMSAPFN